MAPPKIVKIRVNEIRVDGDTQARVAISEDVVAEYAEAMKADIGKANWPPIIVFKEFGAPISGSIASVSVWYWLADGFHRVLAADRAGIGELLADVREGTRRDAKWFALGANKTHGLRRSHADKRKAVELALQMHPDYSDEKVAEHVGVSRVHVFNVRHEMPPQPVNGIQVDTRIGVDGKTRPVPPPRPPPPPPPPSSQPRTAPAGEAPPQGGETPTSIPPAPARQAPAVTRDCVGQVIPPELLPLWNRRQEIQDEITTISRLRGLARRREEEKDPLGAQVSFNHLHAALSTVFSNWEMFKPYAVCPTCKGLLGCRLCCGSGMLSQFRWDSVVADQVKEQIASAAQEA